MIRLKAGDTFPPVIAKLQQADGTAIPDLDTATVRFVMRRNSGEVVVNESATVTDADTGEVRYDWQEGDTDQVGRYKVEWLVTFSDGHEATVPNTGYVDVEIARRLN